MADLMVRLVRYPVVLGSESGLESEKLDKLPEPCPGEPHFKPQMGRGEVLQQGTSPTRGTPRINDLK